MVRLVARKPHLLRWGQTEWEAERARACGAESRGGGGVREQCGLPEGLRVPVVLPLRREGTVRALHRRRQWLRAGRVAGLPAEIGGGQRVFVGLVSRGCLHQEPVVVLQGRQGRGRLHRRHVDHQPQQQPTRTPDAQPDASQRPAPRHDAAQEGGGGSVRLRCHDARGHVAPEA